MTAMAATGVRVLSETSTRKSNVKVLILRHRDGTYAVAWRVDGAIVLGGIATYYPSVPGARTAAAVEVARINASVQGRGTQG